jgi:hypothetical protein
MWKETVVAYFKTLFLFFIFLIGRDWANLLLWPLFGLLYKPQMMDDDDCRSIGGMRIDRGNRSTLRKPAPVPLCPPQILHGLFWTRTRTATVESRLLTAWAMARPYFKKYLALVRRVQGKPRNTSFGIVSAWAEIRRGYLPDSRKSFTWTSFSAIGSQGREFVGKPEYGNPSSFV